MSQPFFVQVALPTPLRRTFDYLPLTNSSAELYATGIRVRVPFGARQVVGIVLGISHSSEIPSNKLRAVLEVLDPHPLLPKLEQELVHWCARYYQHSLGDTYSWALPALLRQGEPAVPQRRLFYVAVAGADPADKSLQRAPKQRELLTAVLQHKHGLNHEQLAALQIQKSSVNALLEKGLLRKDYRQQDVAERPTNLLAQAQLSLNAEQQLAYAAVSQALGRFQAFLLAGVTGSGKTEVYLQLIHQVLQRGQQVLVLIPEINLGPQTFNRFSQRFNAQVVVAHSEMTDRERLQSWLSARDAQADIVIGTRSAVFTPLPKLGLIVIDEEHDSSYKQQEGLRYNARDLALVRANKANVPIVLGSATPSLESWHKAQMGRFALLKLQQRAGGAVPPKFIRLDVRNQQLDSGISRQLQTAIAQTLANKQQVLVFLNRRGFAPVLHCNDCGFISNCSQCDARLTLHQKYNELRCHHCGLVQPRPLGCAKCGSLQLAALGAGTERAEERLQTLFPQYPVLRIDRDSTARKGSLAQMLATIERGEPCILLGTQMLAKGHHFPKVTLVAMLNIDGGLFSADFRASEQMAQLIVQVAGRAGRESEQGRVIIQSELTEHPLLIQLTEQSYFAFAEQALNERRVAGLPPYSNFALLRAEALNPEHAKLFLQDALDLCKQLKQHYEISEVDCLGPVVAPMERRAGRYRSQLLLSSTARQGLHKLLHALCFNLEQLTSARQVRWSLDVDPRSLF